MKMMVERNDGKVLHLPPFSTCQLCRNNMSEGCVEECAPAKDYRFFELKKGVNLPEMPRFPLKEFQEEMSPRVRQVVVAIYVSKIVDALQGVQDERPIIYRARGREIPQALKKQGVLPGPTPENSPHTDRTERPDKGDGTGEMAGEDVHKH
jgi:hypothetical protein